MTSKRKPATVFSTVLRVLIEGRARQAAHYAAGPLRILDDRELAAAGLTRQQLNGARAFSAMLG